ncbi:MAG: hypothetical protein OSA82_02145 [Paracoccaceae bacterium]|nr:hypothetical protein [Paracoccaceae bacterium]
MIAWMGAVATGQYGHLWCHWYRPHRNAPKAQRTRAMSGAATIIL